MKNNNPELLTTRDIANYFSVSERQVRTWKAAGVIKPVKIGHRSVRYRSSELNKIINQKKSK
jgi:excisionase family DNA binding protein